MLAREHPIGELDRDVLRLAGGFAGAQIRRRPGVERVFDRRHQGVVSRAAKHYSLIGQSTRLGDGSRSRGAGPVARRAQDRPNLG